MSFIKTPTKGMRDLLPKDMELREYVLKVMKETYKSFGFDIIQTPAVEHIENLTGRQGGENEKLIFKILKRGEKLNEGDLSNPDSLVDSGLRYDLTVPLARFYANNMSILQSPFRAFQMGNVYRAERNQKGRFREFMQCDLDILGEKTNLAEIELITAIVTFLKKLDFKGFTIKINDRRILLQMMASASLPEDKKDSILIALDKLDKIGIEGVKEELLKLEIAEENVNQYLANFDKDSSKIQEFCANFQMDDVVVENLTTIIDTVSGLNEANIVFDPTLVRGMGYYTGPIFEITVEDLASSIGGGGRYDEMVEKYANVSVPACGFSIGFERLLLLLEERGFKIPETLVKKAYIINDNTNIKELYPQIQEERKEGIIVKVVKRNKNFKFQIESLENDGYTWIEC